MGDIIHQGEQYSLVNNVRGTIFVGQYSLLHAEGFAAFILYCVRSTLPAFYPVRVAYLASQYHLPK